MSVITKEEGILILCTFALAMFCLVGGMARRQVHGTFLRFVVANRDVSWLWGAMSIAVSWTWAPAIFIASLQTYTRGLAGAFWFIVPNVICFFLFAPIAVRVRKEFSSGFTLPEYMYNRFNGDTKTHVAFLVVFFGYQLGAIVINALAGGLLLHSLTGLSFSVAVVSISAIALIYSLISGLEASIVTDVLQMFLILLVSVIIVPWVILESGGVTTLAGGLGGVTGEYGNMFDPHVAYAFGIAMTISLLSGPFGDQMFFQRTFAVKESDVAKTFIGGGLIFAFVPISFCLLGFVGADLAISGAVQVGDPQMIGPTVIAELLPKWVLVLFVFMSFAGLCSTLDSAYCALSALGSIDVYQRYLCPDASGQTLLSISRRIMFAFAVVGTVIALLQPKLMWVFLIYGALISAGFFPTVIAITSKSMQKEAAFWGIMLSLLIGMPMSIYANLKESVDLIVVSSLISVGMSLLVIAFYGLKSIKTGRENPTCQEPSLIT